MTSSGTQAWIPSNGDLVTFAFGLCGIRRPEMVQQHLTDANMAANLLLGHWNNDTPNLWKVEEVVQTLLQGVYTYNVDPSTVVVLDAFIRINPGTDGQYDRLIWPVSRTEYAAQANKLTEAPPTIFWYNRQLSPQIVLWPVPPATDVAELHYWRVVRDDDANLAGGETPDLPNWFMMAFAYGIGEILADLYAPDRSTALGQKAAAYLEQARTQDVETSNTLVIGPAIDNYFVR